MSNFNKMFNSVTITGRANVAKATYASFALLYLMHRLRKRSKAAAKCPDCGCQNCNDSSRTAASGGMLPPSSGGKGGVSEGTCDAETWKRAVDGGKTATANGEGGSKKRTAVKAVEVSEIRNSNGGDREPPVEASAINMDNQNVEMESRKNDNGRSVINEIWVCDF